MGAVVTAADLTREHAAGVVAAGDGEVPGVRTPGVDAPVHASAVARVTVLAM